jgi:hypothetical protein
MKRIFTPLGVLTIAMTIGTVAIVVGMGIEVVAAVAKDVKKHIKEIKEA